MNYYTKIALLSMVVVAGARGEEWNRATAVKFSTPVEAPGMILPAGNYIFRLVENESSRYVVEIFQGDDDEPMATVATIPVSRARATTGAALLFEQKPDGRPDAISQWFYPGDTQGVEFVYAEQPGTTNSEADEGFTPDLEAAFAQFMLDHPLNVVVIPLPSELEPEVETNLQ
jgi:hypothetical protein